MAILESEFTEDDLSLVFDALDEWERMGTELFFIIQQFEQIPPLPENTAPEIVEHVNRMRNYYLSLKRDAEQTLKVRRERACLVKAKVVLQKTEMVIEKLGKLDLERISNPPENGPRNGPFENLS
jgi:hypothetical protein